MDLQCRRCGAPIPAGNINVRETIAVCPNCDAVFNFADQTDDDPYGDVEKPKRKAKNDRYERGMVALPDRFQIESEGDTLHLSYSWFGLRTILITLFGVFWISFVMFFFFPFFGMSFFFGGFGFGGFGGFFSLFPLIFLGASIVLLYYVLGLWINRTHVVVTPDTLRVFTRPLPTFNNKTLSCEDINQLYVQQRYSRSNQGHAVITYEVRALMNTGPDQYIVGSLESPHQALFIEQQIEDYLGIEHRPVIGEWR
jgi:hypothetical protein